MSNATQSYSLFQLLKTGNVVKKELIASTLGVKLMSVPVYIHELKKSHKAEVKGIREGRKVIGYQLVMDIKKPIEVPEFRKNKKSEYKKPTKLHSVKKKGSLVSENGELPVIDKDASTQLDAREFADVADSLGINSSRLFD